MIKGQAGLTGAAVAGRARAEGHPNVLFVSRKWPPAIGGMETYSLKLSGALRKHADVEKIVLPGRADGAAPSFPAVIRFGLKAASQIAFRRIAPDVVHIADMASWPLATLARLRSRRTKVALSAHGTDVAFPDRGGVVPRLYGVYMRLGGLLNRRTTVLANSRATEGKVRGLGFRTSTVVPLATDIESALDLRTKRPGQGHILFAGRLVPRKGCRWFIENVLPLLPDTVHLDVAGTIWDAEEERALSAPRVHYLGALDPGALRLAYANASCVVVPNIPVDGSDFEGFGLVAAEAAAAGGLVLAAAHTGLEDAVIDGETGLKLPAGDASAWASALIDVLQWTEEKRQRFLTRAVETAQRHYSWDRVARSTFQAYGWPA
ncbi:MAG: glycosyltransferase family 4 protein [Paracoccaceae bacterium]|nr:glycosyltransferase family 4 protein [Paracoccaceae bacterium]